jgi:hypothetical protein
MKKLAIVVATLFILSGCSLFSDGGSGGGDGGGSASPAVAEEIAAAEEAIKKSKKAGGEWRDAAGKYLKDAKAAAAKGDDKTALKLAKKAKFEGEMGLQQAKEQANAGPWLF